MDTESTYAGDARRMNIYYKFVRPLKSKVYEEYLITDTIGLIGSVGGTLGLFVGFSFSNILTYIMQYVQIKMQMLFSRNAVTNCP